MTQAGFDGRKVAIFESRRAAEMISLVERYGGAAVSAPAVREVSGDVDAQARSFFGQLRAGRFDDVVFMTGVGTRRLLEAAMAIEAREDVTAALGRVRVVARGPKPTSALRALGIASFDTVPEPATWHEVHGALAAHGALRGRRVAVQEYGAPSTELYQALERDGAAVVPVTVYRWEMPEDLGPLGALLASIAAGETRIALFTSTVQVVHALRAAGDMGEAVRRQLARGCVGSIGPTCSEALRADGLSPDVEPQHSKMGHLVKAVAEAAAAVLARKDAASLDA